MNRIEKLEKSLQAIDESSLLVFNQYNITYLTGFKGHAATVLVTPKNNYLITDYRYFEQAKQQAKEFKVICRDRTTQSIEDLVKELLEKNDISELAFEAEHVSFNQWQKFSNHLNVARSTPVTRLVEHLRYYKDNQEITDIKSAAKIADQALSNILPLVKPGVSEKELATELEYQMS